MNKSLTLILVSVIVLVIGTIIWFSLLTPNKDNFTEFYILGVDGKAQDYRQTIKLGENMSVILGVVNKEQKDVGYRILVKIKGSNVNEINFDLAAGQSREQEISLIPSEHGDNQKVDFLLYKNEQAVPNLTLNLWINVN